VNEYSFILDAASTATVPVADKRAAILRAALSLFAERGYANTPVPMVAETAGVATGSLYRYFSGKEALVNALYREGKLAMAAALPVRAGRQPVGRVDLRDGFGRWWSGLWEFASSNQVLFGFLETHHHAPYLDEDSRAVARAIDQAAEAFVNQAQQAGAVRSGDPAALVALVFGAFVGLVRAGLLVNANRTISEDAAWSLLAAPTPPRQRKANQ